MARWAKDHFSGHAADYAAHRPRYPAELGAMLARLAGGHALALDCGCGSGQLSEVLAQHFERVIATDASAEQIAKARPNPRVEYRVARAEASGLPDRSADLVVAAQAAHWFDLPAFWREAARVARPGGLVALLGYLLVQVSPEIDALVREVHDRTLREYWPPERWELMSGYAHIDLPFEELPAPRMDMIQQWSHAEFVGYLSTWSGLKALERATGASPLSALADAIAAHWGAPEQRRRARFPLFFRLGRVPARAPDARA